MVSPKMIHRGSWGLFLAGAILLGRNAGSGVLSFSATTRTGSRRLALDAVPRTTSCSNNLNHFKNLGPVISRTAPTTRQQQQQRGRTAFFLLAAAKDESGPSPDADLVVSVDDTFSEEEKKEAVGNLVADDEWAGLSMELGEIVKKAVVEDLKNNARDFLGSDDYSFGDLSKEVDSRVKQGVADLRGKDTYEVGDLVLSLDEMSKSFTEDLTGKPYETGDLSREIDSRIKRAVADYVGKDEYEAGDLTKAVAAKVSARVEELIGDYQFGDISREVERRRREWVKDFLGEEAAENYQFGDVSTNFWSGLETLFVLAGS